MTLSTKVLLGLGFGMLTGITVGETVSFLGPIGNGFVLQVTNFVASRGEK